MEDSQATGSDLFEQDEEVSSQAEDDATLESLQQREKSQLSKKKTKARLTAATVLGVTMLATQKKAFTPFWAASL